MIRFFCNWRKSIVIGLMFLYIGMCVSPAFPALSDNDFQVYISAGMLRERWGTFGLGYAIRIENPTYHNISGVHYVNHTTLSGRLFFSEHSTFAIGPGIDIVASGCTLLDFHPINYIHIWVKINESVFTKHGWEIGPFVYLER